MEKIYKYKNLARGMNDFKNILQNRKTNIYLFFFQIQFRSLCELCFITGTKYLPNIYFFYNVQHIGLESTMLYIIWKNSGIKKV